MVHPVQRGSSPILLFRRELSAGRILARFWTVRVVTPLHRALDSALLAGELRDLNAGGLADMGYRRG